MYEQYYGLTTKPFRLTPDPSFLYDSAPHKRALSYLRYGIYCGEGFVTLSGAPGTGKTTLLKQILSELPEEVVVAKLVTTQLGADDTLRYVAAALGLEFEALTKAGLLNAIEGFLREQARNGRRVLVIVDEAQHLSVDALEELRMLTNFQEGDRTLLQCFLIGQEALQELLDSPSMEQLRQRVVASCQLEPLQGSETVAYIEHRLARAGWRGEEPLFTFGAYELIHRHSGGNPRLINALCDRVLLRGYLEEVRPLDENLTLQVIEEMGTFGDDGKAALEMLHQTREAIREVRRTLKVVDSGAALDDVVAGEEAPSARLQTVAEPPVNDAAGRIEEAGPVVADGGRGGASRPAPGPEKGAGEKRPGPDSYIEAAIDRMAPAAGEASEPAPVAPAATVAESAPPAAQAPEEVDASPYFGPRSGERSESVAVVDQEMASAPPVAVEAPAVRKISSEEKPSLLERIKTQLPNIGIGVIVVGLLAMILLPSESPRIYEPEPLAPPAEPRVPAQKPATAAPPAPEVVPSWREERNAAPSRPEPSGPTVTPQSPLPEEAEGAAAPLASPAPGVN